jgi:hypothetical protein
MTKKLDFSKFKKVEGTARYTVFQDSDGNLLRLNHKTVGKQHAKDLQKLPFKKFSNGGLVSKKDAQNMARSMRGERQLTSLKENYSEERENRKKKRKESQESRIKRLEEALQKRFGYSDGNDGKPIEEPVAGPENPVDEMAALQSTISPEQLQQTIAGLDSEEQQPPILQEQQPPAPQGQQMMEQQQPQFTQPGQMMPDERAVMSDLDTAVNEQRKIAQDIANKAKDYAEVQNTVRAAEMENIKNLDNERNAVREQLQSLSSDLNKLKDTKIDPSRVWGEPGSARRITATIGLILGGFGGPNNPAMNVLNKLVEQDIKAQEANLANQRNVLGYNIDLLKDREEGIRLRRSQHYEYLAQRLNTEAAKFEGTKAGLQARQAAEEFALKAAKEKNDIIERQANQRLVTAKALAEAQKPTVAQQAIDKEYAKGYAKRVSEGGYSQQARGISQLDDAVKRLLSGANLTGTGTSLNPAREMFNPESVAVQQQIEGVIQNTLRQSLGAQFTKEEGERLIKRTFNPDLSEKENAERALRLKASLQRALDVQKEADEFFAKHGSLKGFPVEKLFKSAADFDVENVKEIKGKMYIKVPGGWAPVRR